jgi:hypothetical protein
VKTARKAIRAMAALAQSGGYVCGRYFPPYEDHLVGFVERNSKIELVEGHWGKKWGLEWRLAIVKLLLDYFNLVAGFSRENSQFQRQSGGDIGRPNHQTANVAAAQYLTKKISRGVPSRSATQLVKISTHTKSSQLARAVAASRIG